MQIERIRDYGYNSKGFHHGGKHYRKGFKPPLDAITIETVELSQIPNKVAGWLNQYIRDLPDDVVNERMKAHKDSFELIDDALIDSLIIEEL